MSSARAVATIGANYLISDTYLRSDAAPTAPISYKMDYAGLSNLNIKTLRRYLLSYNISTQGMLEKQDLIRAIQSYRPIPEASELYFRQHLPGTPEKSSSMFDDLANLGRSESPSGSSQGSSSSDGWSWDVDKFFSKLFGPDDSPSTQTRPTQSQSQSQPQSQSRPAQPQPRQPPPPHGSTYQPPNAGGPGTNGAYRPNPTQYRPPPGNPPPPLSSQSRGSGPQSQSSQPRPPTGYQQAPRQSPSRPQASPTPTPPHPSRPAQPPSITLDQLMTANTDPSTLPIKAIKTILDQSCVTYVGVVEKRDLVERLQKLIDNTRAEQTMVQEQDAESKSKSSDTSSKKSSTGNLADDDNLCKICCDAALNCVMLNCNHMSTCMDCGKLIMEGSRMCPICREYVVKLLHVFRA
ncbi:hypothetical protein BGX24_000709 [Mortierella sp. AD032]|nr:hypothetical protein BGX24_000709 [Mortierella sp. AD032]